MLEKQGISIEQLISKVQEFSPAENDTPEVVELKKQQAVNLIQGNQELIDSIVLNNEQKELLNSFFINQKNISETYLQLKETLNKNTNFNFEVPIYILPSTTVSLSPFMFQGNFVMWGFLLIAILGIFFVYKNLRNIANALGYNYPYKLITELDTNEIYKNISYHISKNGVEFLSKEKKSGFFHDLKMKFDTNYKFQYHLSLLKFFSSDTPTYFDSLSFVSDEKLVQKKETHNKEQFLKLLQYCRSTPDLRKNYVASPKKYNLIPIIFSIIFGTGTIISLGLTFMQNYLLEYTVIAATTFILYSALTFVFSKNIYQNKSIKNYKPEYEIAIHEIFSQKKYIETLNNLGIINISIINKYPNGFGKLEFLDYLQGLSDVEFASLLNKIRAIPVPLRRYFENKVFDFK